MESHNFIPDIEGTLIHVKTFVKHIADVAAPRSENCRLYQEHILQRSSETSRASSAPSLLLDCNADAEGAILLNLPNFANSIEGNTLMVSILSQARLARWEVSFVPRRRSAWIASKLNDWFSRGGILYGFCWCNMLQIRQKIKIAKNIATNLYNNRTHQPDSTGNQDEGIPLFALKFFEFFTGSKHSPVMKWLHSKRQMRG